MGEEHRAKRAEQNNNGGDADNVEAESHISTSSSDDDVKASIETETLNHERKRKRKTKPLPADPKVLLREISRRTTQMTAMVLTRILESILQTPTAYDSSASAPNQQKKQPRRKERKFSTTTSLKRDMRFSTSAMTERNMTLTREHILYSNSTRSVSRRSLRLYERGMVWLRLGSQDCSDIFGSSRRYTTRDWLNLPKIPVGGGLSEWMARQLTRGQ